MAGLFDPQIFSTTQWTVVLNAQDLASPEGREALERLCRTYWHPLYFFARRKGSSPEDAQDSVQGFFEKLLTKDYLQSVAKEKGKFRTFLLTAFTHYLSNEWSSKKRLKRGGNAVIALNDLDAEQRYAMEPVELLTPETLFDRTWAETVVNFVLKKVRSEYTRKGDEMRFDLLRPCLLGHGSEEGYGALGERIGLSEGGVKTLVRRMRMQFASQLRVELAETLANPADVDTEMRYLLEALMA